MTFVAPVNDRKLLKYKHIKWIFLFFVQHKKKINVEDISASALLVLLTIEEVKQR